MQSSLYQGLVIRWADKENPFGTMQQTRLFSPRAAIALLGLTLGSLIVACGPAVAPAPTPVAADPFIVVRAASEAAFASGKAHLDRGELQAALIDLDTASTNDPDNRQDIQQAIAQTLSQLALQTPSPEPTPVPRTIVVATVPVARQPRDERLASRPSHAARQRGAAAGPGRRLPAWRRRRWLGHASAPQVPHQPRQRSSPGAIRRGVFR